MLLGGIIAALVVGFAAGLFSFKVKSRWCPACGNDLACLQCHSGIYQSHLGRPD